MGATNDRVSGVKGGLDLEMPSSGGINDSLVRVAVETGELDEATLDTIVARNVALSYRLRTGSTVLLLI